MPNYQSHSAEIFSLLSLIFIPAIGPRRQRALLDAFGCAQDIFRAREKDLKAVAGLPAYCIRDILEFSAHKRVEEELLRIEKERIRIVTFSDAQYPHWLASIPDRPTVLFVKGDLPTGEHTRMISVVGTRLCSPYGREMTQTIVKDILTLDPRVYIVSGLARGIDAIAHQSCLACGGKTIAVLAHGLSMVYPPEHTRLAQTICNDGALISEFPSYVRPDRDRFPARNRIISALSQACIVVETSVKRGGAMLTAHFAFDYNRSVFAVPGRTTDACSEGCNRLIQQNKACIFSDATHMYQELGWLEQTADLPQSTTAPSPILPLFPPEYAPLYEYLQQHGKTHIDLLRSWAESMGFPLADALLQLEMMDVIRTLPGEFYRLR